MKNIKIFEICRAVKGFTRSVLYDLGKEDYCFIPNNLCELINNFDRKTLDEIYHNYKDYDRNTIDEYIDFILSNNYGFLGESKEVEMFTELNLEWDSPCKISNAIVYVYSRKTNLKIIFEQLEKMLCKHLLIVCNSISNIDFTEMEHLVENSIFKSIDIQMPYVDKIQENVIIDAITKNVRIKTIFLFDANSEDVVFSNEILDQKIIKTKEHSQGCVIDQNKFEVNLPLFTESQQYNTCLNRKICIDADGNIKNCPTMQRSFGNIKRTTLQEVVEKNDFKIFWSICKDQISVCKDCEFRYMCTDCRCFIKDPENIFSQPSKCTYNPYICKWQNEEGYLPVDECGISTREFGFVPNHEKIAQINKVLWDD